MGLPAKPEWGLLFVAVAYRPQVDRDWLTEHVLSEFGTIYDVSKPFLFAYSKYYEGEMGADLLKMFAVYDFLYSTEHALETKFKALDLEEMHAEPDGRTINLDPGYLTLAKLVLTTTKNFDHRVHLSRGIFADVQLRFRHGEFTVNPWTYPDYKDKDHLQFFMKARQHLHHLVREHEA